MCHVCNQSTNMFYDNLKEILLDRLESDKIVKTIEDLGLLAEEQISKKGTPIDTVGIFIRKSFLMNFTKNLFS